MKLTKLVLLAFTLVSLTSCVIKEEIYFNKDGSGKVNYHFDGTEFIAQMEAMGKGKSKSEDKESDDGEKKLVKEKIYFKDIIEKNRVEFDGLTEKQEEKLKAIEGFVMDVNLDESENKFLFSMYSEFKNIAQLNTIMSASEELNEVASRTDAKTLFKDFSGKKEQEAQQEDVEEQEEKAEEEQVEDDKMNGFIDMLMPKEVEVKMTMTKKRFKRLEKRFENKDNKKEDKEEKSVEEEAQEKMMKQMLGNMIKYKLIYHFPKSIKSVSNSNVKIGADRKRIELDLSILDREKEGYGNFEVKFE